MGASLSFGWGMPTTNACTTSGCDMRTASVSAGSTMKWLILNVSRGRRSTSVRPSASWMPRSPERNRAPPVPSRARPGWRSRPVLEAVELRRVPMRDALGDVRPELAEDPACPQNEPIQHRRLEEPRRPDVDADEEPIGHLFDQPLPAWIERAGLRGEHGRPLEVHAGEIRDEIGIALQESVETAGRTFAAMGEDDRGLSMSGQGPVQGRLRRVGQLVVDDDRHAEFPRDVEDLAEGGAVGVAIDRPATDLTQVNLADHPWPATFQLELELARRGPGGRIGAGAAGDPPLGAPLARPPPPGRRGFLQTP